MNKREYFLRVVSLPLLVEGTEYDDPKQFLELPSWKQIKLINWILNKLEPSKGINQNYSQNGAFKGAMMVAGFKVANETAQNWKFNIKTKSITNLNKLQEINDNENLKIF